MDIIDVLILGFLQGLTEFLPISSSGHLVIGQHLLNINVPGNVLEVVLHLGTLFSVIVVFWKDIKHLLLTVSDRKSQKFILIVLAGTLPAVIIGLLLKDTIESAFDSITVVSYSLVFTGTFLILTKWISTRKSELNYKNGILIGIAQAMAIIPGVSRSGATISAGLYLGLSPEVAARFSFLLAIPAIIGAGLLTFLAGSAIELGDQGLSITIMITGFFSSFVVGWIALKWLLTILQSGRFYWFGVYCLCIGILIGLI